MSIIKLIYSAFLFSILLLATSINLQADPKRLFGDNGADLWMMSELDYAGIFPIRNGEALLVIWSENSADNNAECHCMQILSSNGSAEFVYPVQLSSTSSMVSNIKTASDLQGNIFAAWYEQKNEEDTTEYLYTQKFSPLGEPLWNQEPVRSKSKMVNFNGEIQIKGIDEVIPDKNGGCYVKRKYSDLIAFDENGTHRSNWKPENILRYPWSVIDENGGFWFISLSRKRGENTTYFVKRVNYYGKTLWEDSTKFGANVPERDMNAWNNENIIAHENDLILINEVGRERVKMKIPDSEYKYDMNPGYVSLYHTNKKGRFKGKKYYHQIRLNARDPRHTILSNGNILITYLYYENNETSYWATIYDPNKNKFPSGIEGFKVAEWTSNDIYKRSPEINRRYVHFNYGSVTQTNNGDFLFLIRTDFLEQDGPRWIEIHRTSSDGKKIWEKPYIITEDEFNEIDSQIIGSPSQIVPTIPHNEIFVLPGVNDQFWLTSFINNHSGTDGKLKANLHDYNGNPVFKNSSATNMVNRFNLEPVSVWRNDDYLSLLAFHKWVGFVTFNIDKRGNIIGDPMGNIIIPSIDQVTISNALRTDNRTILLWSSSDRDESRGFEGLYLTAIDSNSDLSWTLTLSDDFMPDPDTEMHLKLAPDKTHAVITATSNEGFYPYKMFWVDVSRGEVIWTKDLFGPQNQMTSGYYNRENKKYRNEVILNDDEIYALYLSYNNVIFVSRLNHDGEELWDIPLRHLTGANDQFVGAKFHEKDGIYVMKQKDDPKMVAIYGKNVLSRGFWRDQSYYVYKKPYESRTRRGPSGRFLVPVFSGNNMWVVPTVNKNYGVQCINARWQKLLGDRGKMLPGFDQNSNSRVLMQGTSDEVGGVWVVWHDPMRVKHYNALKKHQKDKSKEWMQVFCYKNEIREHKEFLLENGEFVICATSEDCGQVKLQIIREGE